MPAGVVAVVNVTAALTLGNITLGLTGASAAAANGSAVGVTGTGAVLSPPPVTPPSGLKTLACPLILQSGSSGSCTLTLSSAATTNTVIALTSSTTALTIPATITVPSGSLSAQFAVKAGGTASQNGVLTATLNGASVTAGVSVTASNVSLLRINAGGPSYTNPSGQVWLSDTSYIGGQTFSSTAAVRQTTTPTLYQTGRTAPSFGYKITVPNGLYTVVLKFAEPTATGPKQRAFNVDINSSPALRAFDVFAQAGGKNVAVDRSFPVAVSNGQILVNFAAAGAGTPLVNAIEVLGGTTTASTSPAGTIRVESGGPGLTDASGLVWSPDFGFTGGAAFTTTSDIRNTATQAIYQTARTGESTYQFAVPKGQYSVILKFAEIQLASPGLRRFNVAINGATVLNNYDLYWGAGGTVMTAVDKASLVVVKDGSICIELKAGMAGAPLLNGIEIIPLQ